MPSNYCDLSLCVSALAFSWRLKSKWNRKPFPCCIVTHTSRLCATTRKIVFDNKNVMQTTTIWLTECRNAMHRVVESVARVRCTNISRNAILTSWETKNQYIEQVNSKTKTTQLRRVHILYEFIHGCTESLALFVYIVLCYTAHRNIVVANSERCFDIRLFSQFYLPRTRTHTKAPAISTSRIYKINFLLRMCVYFSSEDSARLAYFCYCVFAACFVSRGRIAANAFLELKIHIYRRRWQIACVWIATTMTTMTSKPKLNK